MSEQPPDQQPPAAGQTPPPYAPPPPPPAPTYQPMPQESQPVYAGQLAPYPGGAAPIGQVRSTGICILLTIVTFGIYPLYWWFKVHEEMKRHTGNGLGGGVALLLAFFVGFVMPYITSSEVGGLSTRRGQQPKVTGLTGLWYFPGALILVGPLVWFVKTNGALNDYWRSVGAA
jgi:hypothetical protein